MSKNASIVKSILRDFLSRFFRFEDSGWKVVGNGDAGGSVPIGPVSVGGVGGYLDVQVTKGFAARDDVYRCSYFGGAGSIGKSPVDLPADGSVSEGFPSVTFGQIKRLPGAPNASGEPGVPIGFRGGISIASFGVSAGYGGNISLVFLGGPNTSMFTIADPTFYEGLRRAMENIKKGRIPDSPFYKYATVVAGAQLAGPGVGISALKGDVNSITLKGRRVA